MNAQPMVAKLARDAADDLGSTVSDRPRDQPVPPAGQLVAGNDENLFKVIAG